MTVAERPEHAEPPDCWCNPVLLRRASGEGGISLWCHRGNDGNLPDGATQAQAIALAAMEEQGVIPAMAPGESWHID